MEAGWKAAICSIQRYESGVSQESQKRKKAERSLKLYGSWLTAPNDDDQRI